MIVVFLSYSLLLVAHKLDFSFKIDFLAYVESKECDKYLKWWKITIRKPLLLTSVLPDYKRMYDFITGKKIVQLSTWIF